MPVQIRDGADFNNPDAWGFCEWCAFDVAVTIPGGVRVDHRRFRLGGDDTPCHGSSLVTVLPSPGTAIAKTVVSLRKAADSARRRAYWLRQRMYAREKLRDLKEVEGIKGVING